MYYYTIGINGVKMDREEFIKKVSSKVKLIRHEKSYTQEEMASVLGISKKTLVQIEKGRSTLGWQGAVALCTIFKNSEVLTLVVDNEDLIIDLAFNSRI